MCQRRGAEEFSRQEPGSNGTGEAALDDVCGQGWLARIVLELPTPIGAEGYAEIVHRDATLRQLISASAQITDMARKDPTAPTKPVKAGAKEMRAMLDAAMEGRLS